MDFEDRILELAKKVQREAPQIDNEEQTKTALVLPFIQALGYDVFSSSELVPEFSAPIGEYKDAHVDYAILSEGRPIILIECKALGTPLERSRHGNQLQIYFHGTEAPIAILTDGNRYLFYTDLEAQNKMDTKPYLELVLTDLDLSLVPELRKLAKGKFDRDTCMISASELKYTREFKRIMSEQMNNPDSEFVGFFIRQVYEGRITQLVREKFEPILKKALAQFLDDSINERLKNAMVQQQKSEEEPQEKEEEKGGKTSKIVTTQEEIEAYWLVKSLLVGIVEPERVFIRDAVNFCSILLDNSIQQPIFRLHFNSRPWRVGLFDGDTRDEKVGIEKLDDILPLADRIRAAVLKYEKKKS